MQSLQNQACGSLTVSRDQSSILVCQSRPGNKSKRYLTMFPMTKGRNNQLAKQVPHIFPLRKSAALQIKVLRKTIKLWLQSTLAPHFWGTHTPYRRTRTALIPSITGLARLKLVSGNIAKHKVVFGICQERMGLSI
jgi:hypothetical protein